ncbi:homoserine kinase [Sulfurisphaera tokodaii]|uniref:Homoserine kinase n=2 Tax=Sulfurisphaera tokodaii TaxID=111955 RepID=KHSE_SULTO|nr:homoserine kinase [Sulfurisphaera tokodaii]Q975A7.1 RecName: Full=Homoserine kinase; Short=HK; Short=HSK [Sulfurisphaera tokodaii str. 7]BAB65500.1 homoserine kinase [Sulfurisphaera tokodaii str. 7]HII74800.1 homoserine kinase [Sulfurisphaera tokodaii]
MIVKAFSSSANLGAGYDILALAHDAFEDTIEIYAQNSSELDIKVEGNGVPLSIDKNSASFALLELLRSYDIKAKIRLKIIKGIPAGLGLGSSGASAAAAVYAANEIFKLNLSRQELVNFAMKGEIASSGSPHPDNVAASLVGGLVSVLNSNPVKVEQVPLNLEFQIILIIPFVRIEAKTKKAREMVPKQIDTSKYVTNARYLSSLLLGFIKGDRELVRLGLNDEIIEKAREPLFPHYPKIKEISLLYDAIGACVSGAGPTIAIFVDSKSDKNKILGESLNVCKAYGYECTYKIAKVSGGAWVERRD